MKVGILGGGQLARMLILDGLRLNLSFRVYDQAAHPSTAGLGEFVQGNWDDKDALSRFADGLDVITSEFENVPSETLEFFPESVPCFPGPQSFAVAQDRLKEKEMVSSLGIQTTQYCAVSTREELIAASQELGYPFVVKQRQLGYDGKGQQVVNNEQEIDTAWSALGDSPLIAEKFVEFDRELSIIGVFARTGETRFYPLVENHHQAGILRKSIVRVSEESSLENKAREIAYAIAKECEYVGVLVVELFEKSGDLLVNEIAPRVHNSGHWTIEGARTSQFENHLRAVTGLPLGSTESVENTTMLNILSDVKPQADYLSIDSLHLHLYNKEARPKRKLGHITVLNPTETTLSELDQLLGNS